MIAYDGIIYAIIANEKMAITTWILMIVTEYDCIIRIVFEPTGVPGEEKNDSKQSYSVEIEEKHESSFLCASWIFRLYYCRIGTYNFP